MVIEGGGGDSGKFKVLFQGLKEMDSLQLVPLLYLLFGDAPPDAWLVTTRIFYIFT